MNNTTVPKPKIPPHATCVFKGVIWDVYQWQQELYDGTTSTFEMLKRVDTVMVLATEGDKILVAHQEQPGKGTYYDYLGGRAEPNEDPLDAGKRELMEEAGMVSDEWELWHIESMPGKMEWNTYYYIARNCRAVAAPTLDGGEKLTVARLNFDEFAKTIVPDAHFHDDCTRNHLFSLYNPAKAADLAAKIFKGTK